MAISKYLANTHLAEKVDMSEGRVLNTDFIHKFGRNPNVGGAPETIWMQGGIYSYLTSPSTVYVTSNDAADAAAGTGARSVTVQGLDVNYQEVEETLTVGGSVSTVEFLRVFRAFVVDPGSEGTNVGDVRITTGAGGSGTVLADIGTIGTGTTFGLGQSQLALYTIPAHCTGYLITWNVGIGAYNSTATVSLYTRVFDTGYESFRTRDIMDVPGGFHTRNYNVPIKIPARTDIEVRAIASTGSIISASFDLVLVEK
jgi:hypothetical protein